MSAAPPAADHDEARGRRTVAGLPWPRLRTWMLLSAGVWLMLRQVDGVLGELQRDGYGGYGVNDLGPLSPTGLVSQVKALLAVWQANDALSNAAFYTYTALDTVFIVLYAGLLHTLIVRVAAPPRANFWLMAVIAADVIENVLRVAIVATHSSAAPLVYLAWIATTAKWLTLASVLLLVAYAIRAKRRRDGSSGATSRTMWALWRLRIPVALLVPFGLLLIIDPTGQSPDTFRRWFDDGDGFLSSVMWTAGGTALLSAVTWTTVRRTVLVDYAVAKHGPHAWRWAVAGVALAAIALALGWPNLLSFPIVIALTFGLGLLARALRLGTDYVPLAHELMALPARRTALATTPAEAAPSEATPAEPDLAAAAPAEPEAAAPEPKPDDATPADTVLTPAAQERLEQLAGTPAPHLRPEIHLVARVLSVWPLLALLLALASAWTAPPLVLLALGDDAATAIPCAIGAIAALALSPLVAFRLPAALRKLDERGLPGRSSLHVGGMTVRWPRGLELRHLLVLGTCLGLCAAAILEPLSVPPTVGVVGMLSIAMAALVAGLSETQRYGETHRASRGLSMLGFDGLPVVGLLALAFAIASALDDGSYHSVARTGADPPIRAGTSLDAVFEGWSARNCADDGASERTIPMVFVASQGGGIRSAYWTTSVLTALLGAPAASAGDADCPAATAYDRVFALNGVSGGSLGVSSYAGNATRDGASSPSKRWYREAWGTTDLASVPTTWGVLVDLPRSVVGWDGPDRARRFEEAWEARDATMRADFFASQASGPLLIHSSTQVESGCRMNVSPVRLTVSKATGRPGDCALLLDRAAADAQGARPPGTLMPAAPLTSDVLDYLCEGGSLRRSTAALMSARFPYVSPSGRLVHCHPGGDEDLEATAVVDGGYAENTAAQAILDLWARLRPAVAAHNAAGGSRIVPVFVDVDNHYTKGVAVGPVGRTPQLLVPPLTAGRPDKLDDRGVEQLADAQFSLELPGLPGQSCTVGATRAQRYVHIAPPDSPGIPAPLAWTLSDMAMNDLDRQRDAAFAATTPAATLRDALRGMSLRCDGAPAG